MWLKATGIFCAFIAVLLIVVMGFQSHWQQHAEQQVQALYRISHDAGFHHRRISYRPQQELSGLPEPVQRYFETVLIPRQGIIRSATLYQQGQINLEPQTSAWKPFTGQQDTLMQQPGFIWQAKVAMAPGITTFVIDRYYAGQGWLQAKVAGLFTVAEDQGEQEMAEGELMRLLAEAPWYPTRLLPSQGVTWQAIDADTARATLTVGQRSVSLVFYFNDQHLIERVEADRRYRKNLNGKPVYAPWRGVFSAYVRQQGMLLPRKAEVFWQIGGQWQPYWRGEITDWQFRFYPTDIPLSSRSW